MKSNKHVTVDLAIHIEVCVPEDWSTEKIHDEIKNILSYRGSDIHELLFEEIRERNRGSLLFFSPISIRSLTGKFQHHPEDKHDGKKSSC